MGAPIAGQTAQWQHGHAGCTHVDPCKIGLQNLKLKHICQRHKCPVSYATLPDPILPSIVCASHRAWGATELTTECQDDQSAKQPIHSFPSTAADCTGFCDISAPQDVPAPNINKQFVKSLRNVTTMQQLEVCTHDMNVDELDSQSVTAIGTKLQILAFPFQPASDISQSSSIEQAAKARIALSQAQRFATHTWMPLVQPRLHTMDAAGLCICFQTAIHLQLFSPEILEPLMLAWMPSMHTSSPRIQTTMLWCAAQAGFPPPNPWLRRWSVASLHKLTDYSLRELSLALWSFARLRWQPPTSWTQHMLNALSKLVPSTHGPSQAICIPQPDHALPDDQQSSQESHQEYATQPEVQPQLHQCDTLSTSFQGSSQETTTSADLDPSQQTNQQLNDDKLRQGIGDVPGDVLQGSNANRHASRPLDTLHSLSMALWSIPKLGMVPASELTDALLAAAATAMQASMQNIERQRRQTALGAIAMLSHGLLTLQHQPSSCFLKVFLRTTRTCMEAGSSRELAIIGMAVVNWKLTPSPAWMTSYESCSAACLHDCTDQGLVILLDVFAQLSYRPDVSWMHEYQACLTRMMASITPTAAAQLISCFGVLQYRPNTAIGTQLWTMVAQHGQYVPAKRWFPALLAASLLGFTPFASAGSMQTLNNLNTLPHTDHTAVMLHSRQLYTSSTVPSQHDNLEASTSQLLSVCTEKLSYCQPSNLAHMVWACVAWSHSSRDRNTKDETQLNGQGTARNSTPPSSTHKKRPLSEPSTAWHVPQSFLHSLFCAARQKLHVAQPSDVASLLKGLAVLESHSHGKVGGACVPPGLRHLVLEACLACMQSFDFRQLMDIMHDAVLLGGSCIEQPFNHIDDSGDALHASYDSSKAMQQLCNACCKLALEHGQSVATIRDSKVDVFNSDCLPNKPASVTKRRGLRSSMLEIAAVRFCSDSSSFDRDTPLVLCAWQRLIAADFFMCMPLKKRQQLCLALCTAIEQEVEQWNAGAWTHQTKAQVQSMCQGMGVSVHSTFLSDSQFPLMLA